MPVRRAEPADAGAILETIATAVFDDPFWGWVFDDAARRAEHFRIWWKVFVDAAFRNENWNWATDNCGSIALWAPPGHRDLEDDDEAELVRLVGSLIGGDHGDVVL